jgi:hypothetical protein
MHAMLTQGTMILLAIRKSKCDSGFLHRGWLLLFAAADTGEIYLDGTISEDMSRRSPRYDPRGLLLCFLARRVCRTIEAAASFLALLQKICTKGPNDVIWWSAK